MSENPDKIAAIKQIREIVFTDLQTGAAHDLVKYLFELLIQAAEKGTYIGAVLSSKSAADEIGYVPSDSSFKRAKPRVAEALRTCRPDNPKLMPEEDDRTGVACREATIDGVPHLVFVRGPTSDHRGVKRDKYLRLEAEFRPISSGQLESVDRQRSQAPARVGLFRRFWLATAAVGLTLLLAGAVVVALRRFWLPHLSSPAATPPLPLPPASLHASIAVLPFRNESGQLQLAWLGTAISELLANNLSASGILRVPPMDDAVRTCSDLSVCGADHLTAPVLRLIRDTLHVERVLVGSYKPTDPTNTRLFQVTLRMIDTTTGRSLIATTVTGTLEDVFGLVSGAADELRKESRLGMLTDEQANAVELAGKKRTDVIQLYSEGLAKYRLHDPVSAEKALRDACRLDDSFALAHLKLSQILNEMSDIPNATREADRALALSQGLSPELYAQIRAQTRAARRDWTAAATEEAALMAKQPNKLEYGLQQAYAQIAADNSTGALVTIVGLRKLPRPFRDDLRIDLVEAKARQDADSASQKKLSITAASKARSLHARWFIALARLLEATADQALGQTAETASAASDAEKKFFELGDRGYAARAMEWSAGVLDGVDYEGERTKYQQAYAIHASLRDQDSMARVGLNIASILVWQAHPDQATPYLVKARAVYGALLHKTYDEGVTLNTIATSSFQLGDIPDAEAQYTDALTHFGGQKHLNDTANTLTNIGEMRFYRGDIANALKYFNDAINKHSLKTIYASNLAYDRYCLGNVYAIQDNIDEARRAYTQATDVQKTADVNDQVPFAETSVALAKVALRQGHPDEAAKLLDGADAILRTSAATDRRVICLAALAECRLAQGRRVEATEIVRQMSALASTIKSERATLTAAIAAARVRAASGTPADVSEAVRMLDRTHREAKQRLFMISEFEARLALAEIEPTTSAADRRKQLLAVASAAAQKGITVIAHRATEFATRLDQ